MNPFENARKRREAADYRYTAGEYINAGKKHYEDGRARLMDRQYKLNVRIGKYVDYKKKTLREINGMLKEINAKSVDVDLKALEVKYLDLDVECVMADDFIGGSALVEFKTILDTISPPRISDFFVDASEELREAKAAKNEARAYRDEMRAKKEQFISMADSIYQIISYIDSEQNEIDTLVYKLKNAVGQTKSSPEKAEAVAAIAGLIAKTLTTQFLTNECTITSEYSALHGTVMQLNSMLSEAPSIGTGDSCNWGTVAAFLR